METRTELAGGRRAAINLPERADGLDLLDLYRNCRTLARHLSLFVFADDQIGEQLGFRFLTDPQRVLVLDGEGCAFLCGPPLSDVRAVSGVELGLLGRLDQQLGGFLAEGLQRQAERWERGGQRERAEFNRGLLRRLVEESTWEL